MKSLPQSQKIVLEILGYRWCHDSQGDRRKSELLATNGALRVKKTQGEETPHREDEPAGYAPDYIPVPVGLGTGDRGGGKPIRLSLVSCTYKATRGHMSRITPYSAVNLYPESAVDADSWNIFPTPGSCCYNN